MNKIVFCLLSILFGLFVAWPVLAFPDDNPSSLMSGRILFDKNSLNDYWYVYPGDFHRYHIVNKVEFDKIFKNLPLGVSNEYFDKMAGRAPDRLKGMFLIKPEDRGSVYYVNPKDNSLVYIKDYQAALFWFKYLATSTDESVLKDIPAAQIIIDGSGREVDREWQYLGWWGSVNADYVPVLSEPKFGSRRLGTLSTVNRVKVLAVKRNDGAMWYQIDGGRYPGAYVQSNFINPIPQPIPQREILLPEPVETGEYWIDFNVSRSVLTLFQGDEPVFATYASPGLRQSPTIIGTFRVQYKFQKTRMHGGPPKATHYYDLPNVPWTMYYHGSFAVHGTYWHDEFGIPRSAGCTNLTIGDAKFFFDMTGPDIGDAIMGQASATNPGTIVYNHY